MAGHVYMVHVHMCMCCVLCAYVHVLCAAALWCLCMLHVLTACVVLVHVLVHVLAHVHALVYLCMLHVHMCFHMIFEPVHVHTCAITNVKKTELNNKQHCKLIQSDYQQAVATV